MSAQVVLKQLWSLRGFESVVWTVPLPTVCVCMALGTALLVTVFKQDLAWGHTHLPSPVNINTYFDYPCEYIASENCILLRPSFNIQDSNPLSEVC